jgi:hypothetical protein
MKRLLIVSFFVTLIFNSTSASDIERSSDYSPKRDFISIINREKIEKAYETDDPAAIKPVLKDITEAYLSLKWETLTLVGDKIGFTLPSRREVEHEFLFTVRQNSKVISRTEKQPRFEDVDSTLDGLFKDLTIAQLKSCLAGMHKRALLEDILHLALWEAPDSIWISAEYAPALPKETLSYHWDDLRVCNHELWKIQFSKSFAYFDLIPGDIIVLEPRFSDYDSDLPSTRSRGCSSYFQRISQAFTACGKRCAKVKEQDILLALFEPRIRLLQWATSPEFRAVINAKQEIRVYHAPWWQRVFGVYKYQVDAITFAPQKKQVMPNKPAAKYKGKSGTSSLKDVSLRNHAVLNEARQKEIEAQALLIKELQQTLASERNAQVKLCLQVTKLEEDNKAQRAQLDGSTQQKTIEHLKEQCLSLEESHVSAIDQLSIKSWAIDQLEKSVKKLTVQLTSAKKKGEKLHADLIIKAKEIESQESEIAKLSAQIFDNSAVINQLMESQAHKEEISSIELDHMIEELEQEITQREDLVRELEATNEAYDHLRVEYEAVKMLLEQSNWNQRLPQESDARANHQKTDDDQLDSKILIKFLEQHEQLKIMGLNYENLMRECTFYYHTLLLRDAQIRDLLQMQQTGNILKEVDGESFNLGLEEQDEFLKDGIRQRIIMKRANVSKPDDEAMSLPHHKAT